MDDVGELILSAREQLVLRYLHAGHFMEANERMIGDELVRAGDKFWHRQPYRVARGIALSLRRKGLVYHLPDLRAWRITDAGRAAIQNMDLE
jgi:hypothetical protein